MSAAELRCCSAALLLHSLHLWRHDVDLNCYTQNLETPKRQKVKVVPEGADQSDSFIYSNQRICVNCSRTFSLDGSAQRRSQTSQSSRVLVTLEHGGLEVLTEEGSEVQVSGHQLLLHVLQGPLVFHDLQRLPLALTHTNKQRRWVQPTDTSQCTCRDAGPVQQQPMKEFLYKVPITPRTKNILISETERSCCHTGLLSTGVNID